MGTSVEITGSEIARKIVASFKETNTDQKLAVELGIKFLKASLERYGLHSMKDHLGDQENEITDINTLLFIIGEAQKGRLQPLCYYLDDFASVLELTLIPRSPEKDRIEAHAFRNLVEVLTEVRS